MSDLATELRWLQREVDDLRYAVKRLLVAGFLVTLAVIVLAIFAH